LSESEKIDRVMGRVGDRENRKEATLKGCPTKIL
jgi:hypothetical protein